MRRTLRLALLALASILELLAQDATGSSTITLGVGGGASIDSYIGEGSGPAFTGNYEFRALKHLALEAGVEALLPHSTTYQFTAISSGQNAVSFFTPCDKGCVVTRHSGRTQVTTIPFGVKGIWPLWSNRLELFSGIGGAYAFHSDLSSYNSMLGQANLGGRIALDRSHKFWLGASGRFLSNWGSGRQTWATGSLDLGFRF